MMFDRQAAIAFMLRCAKSDRAAADALIDPADKTFAAGYTERATCCEAIAKMLKADVEVRRTLKHVHDVTLTLVSGHDDCDDCFARTDSPESDGEVCRAHGTEGIAVVGALMEARDLLGPCVCGHSHQQHEGVDSTRCKVCACDAFFVPEASR